MPPSRAGRLLSTVIACVTPCDLSCDLDVCLTSRIACGVTPNVTDRRMTGVTLAVTPTVTYRGRTGVTLAVTPGVTFGVTDRMTSHALWRQDRPRYDKVAEFW